MRQWWPFAALCVLAWVRLNLLESMPDSASTLSSQAAGCAAAALVVLIAQWRSLRPMPAINVVMSSAVAGALLLCGPETALFFRVSSMSAGLVIAMALVPVVIATVLAASRNGASLAAASLWPGIAAAAGLLLLVTQPSLASVPNDIAWLLAPVATGVGCVWLNQKNDKAVWRTPAALLGATAVFGVGAFTETRTLQTPHLVATGLDGLLALLSVLALSRLQPLQYAARFAVLPLLVLSEGLVLLRQVSDARALCGLALLTAATVGLLRSGKAAVPEQMPSLRL